jgi:hypothetical protein
MIKYLACAAMCLVASCVNAQDLYYNYGGAPYCPPVYNYGNYYNYNYQPRVVGYAPIVQWIPQGTYLNVGPVVVDKERRRVIMGINTGFYGINGVDTYYLYGR